MHHVHFYGITANSLHRRMVPDFPFERDGFRFDADATADAGWLVCAQPKGVELETRIPRSRRVLLVGEPAALNYLPAKFVNQFGILISPYAVSGFSGFWYPSHVGWPWFFAARRQHKTFTPTQTFQQLVDLPCPTKIEAVSAIVSNKVMHDGHRKRLRFLAMLKERLGEKLVVLGQGIREIDDKAEAILPFAYHLSLENAIEPNYWTEKLSDAFLGWALPIYAGAPNIDQWFPPDSLLRIDFNQPEAACDLVETAIAQQLHQTRLPQIAAARQRVLFHETAFDVIARAITACPQVDDRSTSVEMLHTIPRPGLLWRLRRELHRSYHQLVFRTKLSA